MHTFSQYDCDKNLRGTNFYDFKTKRINLCIKEKSVVIKNYVYYDIPIKIS